MSSDEKDGFIDRLAKKLFASESSPLSSFADQQRAERLAACRQLETVLNECQAESRSGKRIHDADGVLSDDISMDKSRSGSRISRFFRWDKPSLEQNRDETMEDSNSNNTSVNNSSKSKYSHGCHQEIHELWACRALALGCGGYLKDLKRVMNDDTEAKVQKEMTDTSSEIVFEDRKSREDEAKEIQQMMAKCVTKNATELAERIEARKGKK
jgi:hypothetical protein